LNPVEGQQPNVGKHSAAAAPVRSVRPTEARQAPAGPPEQPDVLVFGAGLVGGWVGAHLAGAGLTVTLVGRAERLAPIASTGYTLTDLDGNQSQVEASALTFASQLPRQCRPDLTLLCVKSGATRQAAAALAQVLPPGSLVLTLQNGVANVEQARIAAPQLRWRAGMVSYNVAELAPGRLHRGTGGVLMAQADPALEPWVAHFTAAGVPLALHADMTTVLWAKLLINLNNPVNALSGLPLRAELLDRGYRRCFAALMDEALEVLDAAAITPARLIALPMHRLPALLRLPTPLFRVIAARLLRIDPLARSSMANDLARGRPTEIDALCGEVVRLAASLDREAPLNRRLLELMSHKPRRRSSAELLHDLGA
jgi:2-dehydropantoate 2-reductase